MVRDYVVRTALYSHLEGNNSQKTAADAALKVKNQLNDPIFDARELNKFQRDIAGARNNDFTLTSFSPMQEYEKIKEKKKATSEKLCPEMFQIVLVLTSELLKHIFAKECMKDHLMVKIQEASKIGNTYELMFGSNAAALKHVHVLEATP